MNEESIHRHYSWIQLTASIMILILILTIVPAQSVFADTAGFLAPSIYTNSTLLNAGNAFVSDNIYVQSNGNNKSAVYGNFGFSIPANAVINLVEVSVEGYGNKNWKVAVSNNNGVSYSAFTTITNTAVDTVTVTGGPGTLWGLTGWTAASLTNANFKVKVTSAGGSSSAIAYLDQLKVKVTYTPLSTTPTTLVISTPAAGTYGGTVNLSATLTANGAPLNGKVISFSLDGFTRGTAITNASGIATLSNVGLTTGLSSTLLSVGNYQVRADFAGDSNYAFSSDTDSQVVNPLGITVTADAKSKAYGTNDPVLTYSFTPGLIGTDAFSGALTRTAGENFGTYPITQGTLALSPNYTISYVGANLTITKFAITVKADDKAVQTGNSDPAFTYSTSHFVGSDLFLTLPTCTVSVAHTTAGTYPIVCSGGDAGSNYSVSYTSGTLTVTDKVVLNVTADNKAITYGSADPNFTFTYSGFVDGDTNITGTAPTCNITGSHTNAGSYPSITCSGGLDTKYAFSYTSGTLTVNPLSITVTADPQSKTYGATDPSFTYSFAPALIGTDSFTGALSRNTGEDVNTYSITLGTLSLGFNYTINYVGSILTINKAPLTVTADDQTIGLGVPDPNFTFSYDSFVNGDSANVIDTPPTCTVSGSHTALGVYPIVCSGGLDNNYSFSFQDGTLSVVQSHIDTYIGGNQVGSYDINPGGQQRVTYALDSGPVLVTSNTKNLVIAALRDAWLVNGQITSFVQLMGLPQQQLSDTYYFPAYNNVSLSGQLRIANVDTVATDVTVTIAGIDRGTYHLNPSESVRPTYALDAGPVVVKSSGGAKIIAALRDAWLINGQVNSYAQLMGLPKESLSDTYYFPAYNNVSLSGQLRIGNVDTVATDVTVTIAGIDRGTYHLNPSESVRPTFPLDAGPVVVKSGNGAKIIAALRDAWLVNGQVTSFVQLMGLPKAALSDTYYFPAYNNVSLSGQLRIGNVDTVATDVTVTIAGVPYGPYHLNPNESVRPTFPLDAGPVIVKSSGGVKIIAAIRDAWLVNGQVTSFAQLMGLPKEALSTTYYFPAYNNLSLSGQLRFGIP